MQTITSYLRYLSNPAWGRSKHGWFQRDQRVAARTSEQTSIQQIRELALKLRDLTDDELTRQCKSLRQEQPKVVTVFAFATEAVRRRLGFELYDVQLLAGLELVRGVIAQVHTGEGKTLIALLPAVWHAVNSRSMHVMTVNSYLAKRDYELLLPVYQQLGLSVGRTDSDLTLAGKRSAYACDIVYGPGYEFSFDFLRDQTQLISSRRQLGANTQSRLRGSTSEPIVLTQRGFQAALVDEADSVMLDEASTPLILSPGGGQPAPSPEIYLRAMELAGRLQQDVHFTFDSSSSTINLTIAGRQAIDAVCNSNSSAELCKPWAEYVLKSLLAKHTLQKNVHYVVSGNEVHIVDQNTGRIFAERSWQAGLQQAVQAKERVTVTAETLPAARISRQRFLKKYAHLAGMTGTALGSEKEFLGVYELETVPIAPHRPSLRIQFPTRFFGNEFNKHLAIANEVERFHAGGQPVLVGTNSIQESKVIANLLMSRGLNGNVLNGTQDQTEASIIAQAGQFAAITIATNMAGRGTDIALSPAARDAGGLHVIATQCHESVRVDRQLVGRSARQGDPGSGQFFVSAGDSLLTRHARTLAERVHSLAENTGEVDQLCCGELMEHVLLAQTQAQQNAKAARAQMYAHDDWRESILHQL